MPSIADTYVTIFPETSKIAAGVKTAFREVDPEAREAGRRWGREIQEGIGETTVNLKADTGKARAELDEAARDRHSTVHLGVDRSQTSQVADAIGGDVSKAVSGGVQSGGTSGIGALQPALLGVGITMAAGIASALSGLAGLIPAAIGGAGLGIGTLVAGLDGVKDAWDAVGKSAKDSGSDQEAKAKSVAAATKTLRDAVRDEARAQKDVANARKDARQQLEDLNLELHGGALDEADAILQAQKAREDLATGMFETSTDYEIAQLRVQQADQRVAEAHGRSIDLQEKANDTRAKGVDGADNVVAANDRLAQTQERVADAQSAVNDATSKVSSSAVDAAEKMAALSPAGQALITTLQGMMPQFQAFKFAIQDALLGGIGPQIQQLATTYMPLLQGVMSQMATTMNQVFGSLAQLFQKPEMLASMQTIFNNISASFATWSQSLVPLAQAFTKISEVGSTFLPQLADGAVAAANAFNDFIQNAARTGELQQWIQTGITTLHQLGDTLRIIGPMFLDLAPIGTSVLAALNSALAALAPSIGPLATAFANWVTAMSPILTMVAQLITALMPTFIGMMDSLNGSITKTTGPLQTLVGWTGSLTEALGKLGDPKLMGTGPAAFFSHMKDSITDVLNPLQQLVNLYNMIHDLFTGKGSAEDNARNNLEAARARAAQGLPPFPGGGGGSFDNPITAPGVTSPTIIPIGPPFTGLPGAATLPPLAIPPPSRTALTPGQIWTPGPGQAPLQWVVGKGWVPVSAPGAKPSGANWDQIAGAESGGNWQTNTGNGVFGGLQFTQPTWDAYKPPGAPARADLATPEQQKAAADNALKGQGPGAWPATSAAHPEWFTPQLYSPSNTNPALNNPGVTAYMPPGVSPSDAALLANVPAGSYDNGPGDLTKGLADCSSAVEDLVNLMDGRPTAGRSMATGNEADWLTQHGFLPGMGGPGDFRVGFNSGHTQATLPGGTPFNWGSDAAAARGGVGGTGADDPAFTSHYYRPAGATPGMPTGQPTNPMYVALSPNIPANQQKKPKGDDSGAGQLGQDFLGGIAEIFGLDGSVFKDPTQFGLFKILKGIMGLKPKEGGSSDGGFSGGGGGGGFGDLLTSFIPQPFGDLNIGSPKDAPGQFMPIVGDSGGGAAIPTLPSPFAPPDSPPGVAGPGNQIDNRIVINGNVGPGGMGEIHGAQTPRVRRQGWLPTP